MMKFCAALLLTTAAVSASSTEPCCRTCEDGKEKYYSIPSPHDADPECGECCLEPSRYRLWKIFEPKLRKGDCASQGFTKYKSTETDGIRPLAVTNDRYVRNGGAKRCAGDVFHAVYADMHDGDKKEVNIEWGVLTIKPSGNNQTWLVRTMLDNKGCSANIDFNVPGKPGPPPVNLTATLWLALSEKNVNTELEFTDPSGTLAAKQYPLNRWVQLSNEKPPQKKWACPTNHRAIYADMHDGDKKELTISGSSLTIKPSGNNQTWVVNSEVDTASCSAKIDFNVPGKPGPPPVALSGTLLYTFSATGKKTAFEFTDPSGTLASADFPLNEWVEIENAEHDIVV